MAPLCQRGCPRSGLGDSGRLLSYNINQRPELLTARGVFVENYALLIFSAAFAAVSLAAAFAAAASSRRRWVAARVAASVSA